MVQNEFDVKGRSDRVLAGAGGSCESVTRRAYSVGEAEASRRAHGDMGAVTFPFWRYLRVVLLLAAAIP